MKKLLIASAALAMVTGTAQAQSTVSVYGLIDAGYATSSTSYGAGLETNQKNVGGLHSANGTGSLSGSRLGFRGTEDLGGGLKANFQFESAILFSNGGGATSVAAATTDTTASNAAGFTGANLRQGWLGLSGGFGEFRIGTVNSLAKDATESIDPLSGVTITGVFAQSGLATTRPTNAITYLSPRVSGFQVQAQYDEGESNTSTTVGKDNYASALAVNYVAGPFTAMASMENRKNVGYAAASALVDIVGTDILNIGADASDAQSVDKVAHKAYGATYTVAGVKLAAMATEVKYTDTVAANNGKIKSTLLGATVPVGTNMVVYASVSDGEIVDTGVKTHDIKGYQLVGQYNLSKRTNAYVALGQSKYDSPTANADIEINQAAIGLRHSF
jgi:predicted porin